MTRFILLALVLAGCVSKQSATEGPPIFSQMVAGDAQEVAGCQTLALQGELDSMYIHQLIPIKGGAEVQTYVDSLYGVVWFGVTKYRESGDGKFAVEVLSSNRSVGGSIVEALEGCI